MNVNLSLLHIDDLKVLVKEEISFQRKVLRRVALSEADRQSTVERLCNTIDLYERLDDASRRAHESLLKDEWQRIAKKRATKNLVKNFKEKKNDN